MTLAEFARLFDCSIPEILEKLRNERNDFWRWWWTQFASEQVGIRTGNLRQSLSFFRRILEGVDVNPLLQEIEAKPENWNVSTGRKSIGVQQHTESILLQHAVYTRAPSANNVQVMMDIQETKAGALAGDYPKLMDFLNRFSASIGKGSLSRAMIVRLAPKKDVGRHWDTGYYYLCRDRYHLVLRSAGSRMECSGVRSLWNVGELWWFNNNMWHSAGNEGDDWRIHVIFDVLPDRNAALVDEFKRHTRYYEQALAQQA